MNKMVYRADSRGVTDCGWLYSRHTFSFAHYQNPERMGCGKLRVLNDDIVESGRGFDDHAHDNMEIVSIPITGVLRHRDSLGHEYVISNDAVQIMSAGTGITHSEYNDSSTEPVNFLQIWIAPKEKNIAPCYAQQRISEDSLLNRFSDVVTPQRNKKNAVWINQDAYLALGYLNESKMVRYTCRLEKNALYIFLIDGRVRVADEILSKRDGIALEHVKTTEFYAEERSKVLVIETTSD